jgi:hypothetical protein
VLFDLNYVNMWYLMSMINFVYVLMLDLPQLFRLINYSMIDINVMLCIVFLIELEFFLATCI